MRCLVTLRDEPERKNVIVALEAESGTERVFLRTITGYSGGTDQPTVMNVAHEIALSRSEARAIASGLMGCAAEMQESKATTVINNYRGEPVARI